MVHVKISYSVEDYNKWKSVFDSAEEKRKSSGCKSAAVYVSPTDGKQLTILFEWDTKDNFTTFSGADEIKALMKDAGVLTPPDIKFLE